MTRIAFVRHGQTEWNRQRLLQGQTDIPLDETGREQAADVAARLVGPPWTAIYASTLARATETAQIIAAELGLAPVRPLPGIVERNYGEAEGMAVSEYRERFPDESAIAGYEDDATVVGRVLPALQEVAAAHPDEDVLVVSHGAVVRLLLAAATDGARPAPGEFVRNASIQLFEVDASGIALLEAELVAR
jgi:uncharacterized phosphatase